VRVALDERKGRVSTGDLVRMLHALLEIEPMYRKSGQPQLLLETLLVRFALLDRTIELEEVLKGFGAGGHEDPPPRRVAHDSRVASAHALPPAPPPAVAPALPNSAPLSAPATFTPPPPSRTATQQAAAQAAAQQIAAASSPASSAAASETRPANTAPPTLEQVKARWSQVAQTLRANGRGMVAEAVQRLTPMQVSPDGALTLGYSLSDDTFAMAVDRARANVIAALQDTLPGLTTYTLHASAGATTSAPAAAPPTSKRLTAHDVQQQRTEQIAAKDPLLEAAVRVLDLELLD
jgi:DNA polymerase-3 subunit gamma/tau